MTSAPTLASLLDRIKVADGADGVTVPLVQLAAIVKALEKES